MQKRILYIINVDWFFISHRLPIAQKMQQEGYEVHVALKITDHYDLLNSLGFIVHDLNFSRNSINFISELNLLKSIYRLFKKVNPSICHLVTAKPLLYGGFVSKILKVPAVIAFSGLGHAFTSPKLYIKFIREIILKVYKFIFSRNKIAFIFQNSSDLAIIESLNILKQDNTHLIKGSGIDIKKFMYQPEKDCTPRVVTISRLLRQKGIIEFLKAAEHLLSEGVNAEFVVYGEIDTENPDTLIQSEVEYWSNIKGITFSGFTNTPNKVLENSHILVLPSYYGEGLPKTLIEGSACGRAIITTDHPGCRDAIIPNKTGLLVPVRDEVQLSKAIYFLLENSEVRKEMGKEGRKLAEREYDIKSVIIKHLEIYQSLV